MNEQTDVWAIVELMGHVRLAGRLTEEEKFGTKMGRLDIPIPNDSDDLTPGPQFVTQLFGGASVYRITIVTEAVARQVARKNQPAPVSPWDYPKQLTTNAVQGGHYEDRVMDCGHTPEDCDCDPAEDDDHPY